MTNLNLGEWWAVPALHGSKVLRGTIAVLAILHAGGCAVVQDHSDSAIEIHKLDDGVWMHTSYHTFPDGTQYPSNGLIVKDNKKLILVDTAWGELQTLQLLRRIESEIGLPVAQAVVTHAHSDRTAGVDVLDSNGIEVFAHPMTQTLAIKQGLPVPDNALDAVTQAGQFTTLGSIEVVYPGPAHAPDNLMVWIPEEKILFGGCAVRAGDAESAGNTADADIKRWLQALRFVQERYLTAKVVVPGHGKPGGPELLQHTSRLIGELNENTNDEESGRH